MTHELKCWPEYFQEILDRRKTFEVRRDDRGFMEGETLRLREWDPELESYSGREIRCRISYIVHSGSLPHAIQPDYCVMAIQVLVIKI